MRLFPEVRSGRGFDFNPDECPDEPNPNSETTNGAVTEIGNAPPVLTLDGLVRITVQKAPRLGFEQDHF
jgi:hypothetical protein